MRTNPVKAPVRSGLAAAVLVLLASQAEAQANEPFVALGIILRNGDRFAVDLFGGVLPGSKSPWVGRCVAPTVRGELGIGGSAVAVGLAMAVVDEPCTLESSIGGGIVTLEARFARMYGRTDWRHTEYIGPQYGLATPVGRLSAAWMFDVHDPADNHFQGGFGLGF